MNIIQSPSQNFDNRTEKPEVIVIHCTDSPFPQDLNWLRSPVSNVSSHYLIAPDGAVHQLVDPLKRAWHAGRVDHPTAPLKKSVLGIGYVNPNEYSIGIEVSLLGTQSIGEEQYNALRALVKELSQRFGIPIDRAHVWGHKEIFSLKTCPGRISVEVLVRGLTPINEASVAPVEGRDAIKQEIIRLLNKL